MLPRTGDTIGSYSLGRVLGVGGIATVFRATGEDGEEVALKVLHPGQLETEEVTRFYREYRTLRHLDHPNVVKVLDAGSAAGLPWLAMELVEGGDLGALVETWSSLPLAQRFRKVEQVLRGLTAALTYLHERGLVHRDLKPSNVLIARDGSVRLTDFGGVKGQGSTQLTTAGRLVGTVAFMAPEVITNEGLGPSQDLYSLGAILYVMLTGRPPIEASTIAGYLARHISEEPTPPSKLLEDVPPALERVCLALLRKDPEARPASARQVLEMLDRPPEQVLPIRGRDEVLARLRRHARGSLPPHVLALSGPVDSGRSAILGLCAADLRAQGVEVLHLRGTPGGEGAPRDRLLAAEDVARRMGQILPHHDVVLLVDDAELLAGEGLPLFLPRLWSGPRLPRVILAGAEGRLTAWARDAMGDLEQGMEWLPLPRLDRATVIAMLRDRGLAQGVAALLGRRLQRHAEGLPGRVIDQLQALLEAGWLERWGERIRPVRPVEDLKKAPLPLSARARGRAMARLEGLEPATVALLQGMAVVGEPCPIHHLAAILGTGPHQVRGDAGPAVDAGLLHLRPGLDEILEMDGLGLTEAIRGELEPERRRELHRAVASFYESHGRRRRGLTALVARHRLQGGQPAAALPLLVQAAADAWRGDDTAATREHVAAARSCQAALGPGMASQDAAMLDMVEGELELATGLPARARDLMTRALGCALAPSLRTRALMGLGKACLEAGEPDAARPPLEEALALHGSDDPTPTEALAALAVACHQLGDHVRAGELWGASLAHPAVDRPAIARALAGRAVAAAHSAPPGELEPLLDDAEERLRELGERAALLDVLALQTRQAWCGGRLREALDRAIELEQSARSLFCERLAAGGRALRAEALWSLGRGEAALAAAEEALALGSEALCLEDSPVLAWRRRDWTLLLGALRVLSGDRRSVAGEGLMRCLDGPLPDHHLAAWRHQLLLAHGLGQPADLTLIHPERSPPGPESLALCQTLHRLGDQRGAARVLESLDATLGPEQHGGLLLEQALLARALGLKRHPTSVILERISRVADLLGGGDRADFLHRPDIRAVLEE